MANKASKLKIIIPAAVFLLITAALFVSFLKWEHKSDPASERIIREIAAECFQWKDKIIEDPNELTNEGFVKVKSIGISGVTRKLSLSSNTFPVFKDLNELTNEDFVEVKSIGISGVVSRIRKDPNSLTDEDFAKIKSINISQKELSDIRLLKKFTNLQQLSFYQIQYPESKTPKWMQFLMKLGVFNPEEQFALDLSPLANLTNLQTLYITKTNVSDITPLANLKNLKSLSLYVTHINDIQPLANLTNLQELELYGSKVSDIKALANLTKLQKLDLSNTNIRDISVLANLTNLNELSLVNSNVNDITPLANLKNLETLKLGDWETQSHYRVLGIVNWLELDSEHTGVQINDIKPLANLTNLKELFLDETQVSDLKPLANLINLQRLSLLETNVSDEQVAELKKAMPKVNIIR